MNEPIKSDNGSIWWFPDELLGELAGRDGNKPLNPAGTLYGMPIVYSDKVQNPKAGEIAFGDGKVRLPLKIKQEDGKFVMRKGKQ